jgi:hypothetical protein
MGALRPSVRHLQLTMSAVLVLAIDGRATVAAQTASSSALKAAFLLNFAKFTEWTALPASAPVRVCVAGDPLVATALADTLRGQAIDTHGLQAVHLESDAPARDCQVLFVSGGEVKRVAALAGDPGTGPVLTVSDAENFARNGGMVELFVESGRMKFAINLDAVQRSRIRLSSRLLGLARIVRDQHGI